MVAKGSFKHGVISSTNGQEKKHVSQMTKYEINLLREKLLSLKLSKTKISKHLIQKMESKDMTFTSKHFVSMMKDFNIIEFNRTRGQGRVLIRGNKSEKVMEKSIIVNANLCIVFNLTDNEIVTAYWNYSGDNHQSIDMNRYNEKLKIRF